MCRISDSDKCYYCGAETETIEHLFWYCPIVKHFWYQISEKLDPLLNITHCLNAKSVLLGYLGTQNYTLVNHLFNIIKRYIYITKCKECALSLERLFELLKFVYSLEGIVVKQTGKMQIFKEK